jgi:hypothetical protein
MSEEKKSGPMNVKLALPVIIVIALAVGAGGWCLGAKYGSGSSRQAGPGGANFREMTPEQRQQFQLSGGGGRTSGGGMRVFGGGFTVGEILSKDDKSITIKMPDGGTKIVFLAESTTVSKQTEGSAADLEAGKTVMVTGKANDDGSLTAQTIQLRPALPTPPPAE